MSLRTLFSIATLFVLAPAVLAQSWTSISVPQDDVIVPLRNGSPYTSSYVVREGQQPLLFVHHSSSGGCRPQRVIYNDADQIVASVPPNGLRWHPAPSVFVTRPEPYTVKAKVVCDGVYLVGEFTQEFRLFVVPPAQSAFRDNTPRVVTGPDGVARTRYSTLIRWEGGANANDRPVLVVEGIDAANANSPSVYYGLGAGVFTQARQEGADVSILDFADGGDSMQANSLVVQAAIRTLRDARAPLARKLDVIGVSMGGVVARHALNALEAGAEIHQVGHFVSMDAPQQGAVLDAYLQSRVGQLAEDYDETPPLGMTRPAALQLLKKAAFDLRPLRDGQTEHHAFYTELRAMLGGRGYPRNLENIGVAFSSPQPNPDPGAEWLELRLPLVGYDGTPVPPNRHFYVWNTTGSELAEAGSYLPVDVTDVFGHVIAPVNYFRWMLERKTGVDPAFIPHRSALDLTAGPGGDTSPFAPPLIFPITTTPHNIVPDDVIPKVLNRLGYGLPPVAEPTVWGPDDVRMGEAGTWELRLPPSSPAPVQYLWQYRIYTPGCPPPLRLQASASSSMSSRLGGGGEVTPNLVDCAKWTNAGTDATVTLRFSGSVWMELRATATLPGGTAQTASKEVAMGYDGGGGEMAAAPGVEEAAGDAQAEAALIVQPRPTMGVHPNVVRAGSRTTVTTREEAVGAAVYDMLGRERARLRAGGAGRWDVDTRGLEAGVYVVRVHGPSWAETHRLLVTSN